LAYGNRYHFAILIATAQTLHTIGTRHILEFYSPYAGLQYPLLVVLSPTQAYGANPGLVIFRNNQQAYSWMATDLLIFLSFQQAYSNWVHYPHTVGPTTYMHHTRPMWLPCRPLMTHMAFHTPTLNLPYSSPTIQQAIDPYGMSHTIFNLPYLIFLARPRFAPSLYSILYLAFYLPCIFFSSQPDPDFASLTVQHFKISLKICHTKQATAIGPNLT